MTKHIPVPKELLERAVKALEYTIGTTESGRRFLDELRALLDGPGVEPVAYRGTAFPDSEDFTYDKSEQVLREFGCVEIDPLYLAAPSAPVARCHECGKQAGDGWALYCVECAGKVAPVQAVQEAVEKLEACDKVLRELQGKHPVQAVPDGWQLINRTPTPEQRELLLRADEFTTDEMWVMLLAAAPQPSKEIGE